MLRRLLFTSVTFAVLTIASTAEADLFRPKMSVPKNYKDFQYGVDETRDNIESVQCGGWVAGTEGGPLAPSAVPVPTITATNADGTPDPTALPGRDNVNPLFNRASGVGERGIFQYPQSAFGFASACDMYITSSGDLLEIPLGPHTEAQTMYDEDLDKILHKDIHLKNTPCGDSRPECIDFDGGSVELIDGGTGRIQINPYGWCIRWDRATPKYCKQLRDAWNAMSQLPGIHIPAQPLCDCESVVDIPHDPCPPRPPKRYCFDPINTFECRGTSAKYNIADAIMETTLVSIPEGGTETPFPAESPRNSTCRTDWTPIYYNKLTQCTYTNTVLPDGSVYGVLNLAEQGQHIALPSSFYRHYAGGYMEAGVQISFDENPIGSVRAECYEYYKETNTDGTPFDPQIIVTGGIGDGGGKDNDEQCEIVPTSPITGWPEIGERKQRESVPDPNPPIDTVREPREGQDPWVLDTETNLALLDIKKLKSTQQAFDDPADITGVASMIIEAKQRGSKTVPRNARTDSVDDTDHRGFGAYWEDQEKALSTLVRSPTVRLIMPARFIAGLDDENPLFQYVRGTETKSNGTVELTLRAGPEDLGSVLEMFRSSYFMPLSEVRIPILLPLASVIEIDRLIFEWKQWKQDEEANSKLPPRCPAGTPPASCPASFANRADPLIAKLLEYKTAIEQERVLRNALDRQMIRYLAPVQEIQQFMAGWYNANALALKQAADVAAERLKLKRIWRHIQNSMLQADSCQLQWCSNMRYTVAVYSLLDRWWGDAAVRSPRNSGYRPPDIAPVNVQDQVYDFSFLSPSQGTLEVPVLWPIQVKVNLPIPPLLGSSPPDASAFPELPALPNATVFDDFSLPDVTLPSMRLLSVPPSTSLASAKQILRDIRTMIDGTSNEDQGDQEEREDANGGIVEDEGNSPNFSMERTNMRGAYCRFIRSVELQPNPDLGDSRRIVHVENDLRERVARLYARWLPNRYEDFSGRASRLRAEFPESEKPECTEDLICAFLPSEKTTTVEWQLFLPEVDTDFTEIRNTMQSMTLPSPDQNPYEHAPFPILERLFPNLPLPVRIDLLPSITP